MSCSTARKSLYFPYRARLHQPAQKNTCRVLLIRLNAIKAKGVDTIACMAVNDMFVMDAWGNSAGAGGKVLMLADGNGTYAAALGLELDASGFGLGTRGQRFALVVEDATITQIHIEAPMEFKVSSAENILENL